MKATQSQDRSARLLFFVTALFWSSQYSYTQFINPELQRMGMNAAFMGLVSGAYGFTQTLLRIPLGIWADKTGRQKPFVVVGSLLAALASSGFLLFYSPMGFLFSRGLAGVASASWVSFTILYSSYYPHEEGPRRISQLNAANMSGRLSGYVLILAVVPLLGLKSAFAYSVLAGAMAFLLSTPLSERQHPKQGISIKVLLKVAKDRYLLACSLICILAQVVAFSTYYGFTINIAKGLGAQDTELTLLNIALLVPTILMNMLVTGKLLNRYTGAALVSFGFLAGALYSLLVPLSPSLYALYPLQVLGGIASTLTFGVLLGQSVRDIKQELRAVAMGFHQAVYGIGMTLGPILMGVLIDLRGFKPAFFTMAVFCVVSSALAWYMLGRPRKIEA